LRKGNLLKVISNLEMGYPLMKLEAIYHRPYSEFAFPIDPDTLVIRLRTAKNDINNCILIYHEKYDFTQRGKAKMNKVASDEMFDYYEVELNVGIKRFKYMFYLEDVYSVKWYSNDGFFDYMPQWGHFTYSYICKEDIFEEVEWFCNSTIYQIFPDRFAKVPPDTSSVGSRMIHGGNIKGILDKFDYLVNLGVDVIYLNPVFKSESYHRYDIVDYYEIDPAFGDKRELKELIDMCHRNGIKVIFDGVFNHSSDKLFAFKDVVEKGEKSKYVNWFHIYSFPVEAYPRPNYECFSFYGGMPKLNTGNPETAQYLLDVVRYWTEEFGVDGWRLDAADEVDRKFWRKLRDMLKSLNRDTVLIGEIYDESSSWLWGDQFDSVMNYPLKWMVDDFFAHRSIDVETFKKRINGYIMKFNKKVLNSLVNVISTHDTPRFLTLCDGDEKKFEPAVVFQFTFPGVPLIYYGDEIGMEGEGDPDCRRPMIWDEAKWNGKIFELYRFLIDLRKRFDALRVGEYGELNVTGGKGILAYRRGRGEDGIIVVMNTLDQKENILVRTGEFFDGVKAFESLKDNEVVRIERKSINICLKPFEWRIYKACGEL